MRNLKLEKSIKKLDKEMEALKISKKYLSNHDEIDEVREFLNNERQVLADELYLKDSQSLITVNEKLEDLLGEKLNREEQKELLSFIKETYGRQLPNPSKEGNGLSAWLKFINADVTWTEEENGAWVSLVVEKLNN